MMAMWMQSCFCFCTSNLVAWLRGVSSFGGGCSGVMVVVTAICIYVKRGPSLRSLSGFKLVS